MHPKVVSRKVRPGMELLQHLSKITQPMSVKVRISVSVLQLWN